MADGDIHAKLDDDGTPMFRMEGYPTPLIEDVVPGRSTGLRDMVGNELFDGDRVVNHNIPEGRDRVCQIRRIRVGQFAPFWSAGGTGIESISESQNFGVRKILGL